MRKLTSITNGLEVPVMGLIVHPVCISVNQNYTTEQQNGRL